MLSTDIIIIDTDNGKREFLISPIRFGAKELPDFKSGKIFKLYFYENWIDEEYKTNLKKESLADNYKTNDNLINFGQDFNKFYVGCLTADFENRTFSGWHGEPRKLSDEDAKILQESLSNPDTERRRIVMFTPTRPADFNLTRIKGE